MSYNRKVIEFHKPFSVAFSLVAGACMALATFGLVALAVGAVLVSEFLAWAAAQ